MDAHPPKRKPSAVRASREARPRHGIGQDERRHSPGDAQQHSKAGGTKVTWPRRYLVVIEKGARNYSAYSPDIPGCIATGRTRAQTAERIRQAIRFHLMLQ